MKKLSRISKWYHQLISILKDTVNGVSEDNVTTLSASLAYATLFSIIPLISLLIAFGVFLHINLADQLYIQLEPIVGKDVIEALRGILSNADKSGTSGFATIISFGVSIFGATTIFAEMQNSLNTIWRIKAIPKKGWLKYIKNRLLSFSLILVFAFILLITFGISNIIESLSQKFMDSYPDVAISVVKTVGVIFNLVLTVVIFTLLFKVLPDAKIKSKDVLVGAIVTTILLLIGQWGISFYIGMADIGTIYGAAAFMIILLTWIYYSAIIIYTGAEFTRAWANEVGGKIFPDEYAVATKTIELHENQ